MEGTTMTTDRPRNVTKRRAGETRGTQKATTFTPADARRLEAYAAQQDRSVAYLLHRAMVRELDEAGVVDPGEVSSGQ